MEPITLEADVLAIGGGLVGADWMARILDVTWRTLPQLAGYYPFGPDG